MPTNTLTDAKIRSAKPAEKAQKLFDGGGLHLYVTPKGAKVWRLAYRLNGKPQQMSLGPYPEVGLAAARARRDEVKAQLRAGEDPLAERHHGRQDEAQALTVQQAADAYWAGRKDITDAYRLNATRALDAYIMPALGCRPIKSITRADLLEELNKIDQAGKHSYVRKVRLWASQVWDWAVEQEHCEFNPAALIDPEKAFGQRPEVSHAAIELSEVGALLGRMSVERDLQSVLACRLLALTWLRTVELRTMLWSNIDGDTLRIPAGRMKRRRDHLVVPLSRQALAILKTLKERAGQSAYVFPSDRRDDRPMSENSVVYLLHRIGYKGRMTGHGWRSIGSTWANERGLNPDAIEMQLAHAPDNKVRSAYNRARYMSERKAMLQEFADWLDRQERDWGARTQAGCCA